MSQLAQLIGTGETAIVLGWSRAKVKREARAGHLPYAQKLDGRTGGYLFERTTITTIARNRAKARSNAA